jgi:hypothetical protein
VIVQATALIVIVIVQDAVMIPDLVAVPIDDPSRELHNLNESHHALPTKKSQQGGLPL